MPKFIVHFEQVTSYDVEVTALDEDDAQEKAMSMLDQADKQTGYIEYCYTDKEEED